MATWDLRSIIQAVLVAGGGLLMVAAVVGILLIPRPPAGASGFAEGLAVLFLAVHGIAGFVLFTIGWLIPDARVNFATNQRYLLAWGLIAPISGVAAVLLIGPMSLPFGPAIIDGLVTLLTLLFLSGPIAVAIALAWRYRSGAPENPDG